MWLLRWWWFNIIVICRKQRYIIIHYRNTSPLVVTQTTSIIKLLETKATPKYWHLFQSLLWVLLWGRCYGGDIVCWLNRGCHAVQWGRNIVNINSETHTSTKRTPVVRSAIIRSYNISPIVLRILTKSSHRQTPDTHLRTAWSKPRGIRRR